MSNQIDLILPGLLNRNEEWRQSYIEKPHIPNFQKLIRLSDHEYIAANSYEATLLHCLGVQNNPEEELTIPSYRIDESTDFYCRADPIHLKAGISDLILIDELHLDILEDEKKKLEACMNTYLKDINGFYTLNTQHGGILHIKQAPPLYSSPISQIAGNGIHTLLPRTEHGKWWHQLMNEFQMLLHDSEVNQLRQSRGKVPINGIWCWAGGNQNCEINNQRIKLLSQDPFAQETAQALKIEVSKPDQLQQLLTHSDTTWVVSDTRLQPLAQYDDYDNWYQQIEALDKQEIATLIQAMFQKRISTLKVYPCNGRCYTLKPNHRWRIWRQKPSRQTHIFDL